MKTYTVVVMTIVLLFLTKGTSAVEPPLEEVLRGMLGQPGGLTSEQAAARAMASDYTLQAKQAQLDAAKANVARAQSGYMPKLTGTARYTRLSETPESAVPYFTNQYHVQGEAVVPLSDYVLKTYRQVRGAQQSRQSADLEEKAERLSVAAQARISYYDWVRAQALLVVARQRLSQVNDQLTDVEARYEAGSVILADVLQTRSQMKRAELELNRSENRVTYATEVLRTAMHDVAATAYKIGERFEPEDAKGIEHYWTVSLADLRKEALDERLELKAYEARQGAEHEREWVKKSELFPKLEGFAANTYAKPNDRYFPLSNEYRNSWYAGGQVVWTLSDIPGALAASRASRAQQRSLRSERLALADAVHLEVTRAWESLEEAKTAIETTRQGLQAAEEAYRVRNDAFRVNKATSTELSDSVTQLTFARLEAINAIVDLRIADVRLRHAVGRN